MHRSNTDGGRVAVHFQGWRTSRWHRTLSAAASGSDDVRRTGRRDCASIPAAGREAEPRRPCVRSQAEPFTLPTNRGAGHRYPERLFGRKKLHRQPYGVLSPAEEMHGRGYRSLLPFRSAVGVQPADLWVRLRAEPGNEEFCILVPRLCLGTYSGKALPCEGIHAQDRSPVPPHFKLNHCRRWARSAHNLFTRPEKKT